MVIASPNWILFVFVVPLVLKFGNNFGRYFGAAIRAMGLDVHDYLIFARGSYRLSHLLTKSFSASSALSGRVTISFT